MFSVRTLALAVLLACPAAKGALTFSGNLPTENNLAKIFLTFSIDSNVYIQTYQFGGNPGLGVSSGGIDSWISLFAGNDDPNGLLLYDNDDGDCPPGIDIPYCGDSTLSIFGLLAGDYTLVVTVSPGSPIGPTLGAGFNSGDSALLGSGDYFVEVSSTSVPEPASVLLGAGGLALILAMKRYRKLFAFLAFLPSIWATDFVVPPGGDVQAALNAAQPGDNIILHAGGTYVGNFVPPVKPGASMITIRTDSATLLAKAGKRVGPADAAQMPKIVIPSANPALFFQFGSHHYQVIGIEFYPASGVYPFELIRVGGFETQASDMPHDIVIDRCYFHGDPVVGGKNAIVINANNVNITNSYMSGFVSTTQETHAIQGTYGGPYQILNNYLEASGVNILFGGAIPSVPGASTTDVKILRNHIKKLLTWKPSDPSYGGIPYQSKNLLEIKFGQRFLIDGNVMENAWYPSELGRALVIAVFTEDGNIPGANIEDITITRNIFKNLGVGLLTYGRDVLIPTTLGHVSRLLFQDNLFIDVLEANSFAGNFSTGVIFTAHSGVDDLQFLHNTYYGDGQGIISLADTTGSPHFFPVPLPTGFRFEHNLIRHNINGIAYNALRDKDALDAAAPGYTFFDNVVQGGAPANFPAGNFFPADLSEVKFANLPLRDLRLTTQSPYFRAATDGKDIGADMDSVATATSGVVDGTGVRCITSVAPASFTFTSTGGTGTANVTAPGSCFWQTSILPGWVTVTSGFSALGSGPVQFSVPPLPPGGGRRTFTLPVGGLKIVVTQNP